MRASPMNGLHTICQLYESPHAAASVSQEEHQSRWLCQRWNKKKNQSSILFPPLPRWYRVQSQDFQRRSTTVHTKSTRSLTPIYQTPLCDTDSMTRMCTNTKSQCDEICIDSCFIIPYYDTSCCPPNSLWLGGSAAPRWATAWRRSRSSCSRCNGPHWVCPALPPTGCPDPPELQQ